MWILRVDVLKLVQPFASMGGEGLKVAPVLSAAPCSAGAKKPRAGRVNRNGALCGGGNLSAGLRLVVVLVVELPGAVVRHGVEQVLHLRRALAFQYHALVEL